MKSSYTQINKYENKLHAIGKCKNMYGIYCGNFPLWSAMALLCTLTLVAHLTSALATRAALQSEAALLHDFVTNRPAVHRQSLVRLLWHASLTHQSQSSQLHVHIAHKAWHSKHTVSHYKGHAPRYSTAIHALRARVE